VIHNGGEGTRELSRIEDTIHIRALFKEYGRFYAHFD
jgi:hypothetical protein